MIVICGLKRNEIKSEAEIVLIEGVNRWGVACSQGFSFLFSITVQYDCEVYVCMASEGTN